MKKLLAAIIIALVMCSCAGQNLLQSEGGEMDIPRSLGHSFIDTISISADGSANLPAYWKGWYISQVEVLGSLDDAVTVTFNSPNGGEIGTITTTAATDGEFMPLASGGAETRYITGTATYTVADLGAGTLTLTCVLVQ